MLQMKLKVVLIVRFVMQISNSRMCWNYTQISTTQEIFHAVFVSVLTCQKNLLKIIITTFIQTGKEVHRSPMMNQQKTLQNCIAKLATKNLVKNTTLRDILKIFITRNGRLTWKIYKLLQEKCVRKYVQHATRLLGTAGFWKGI